MIKEEDILLSKMSYTDKDFASIYPDLLDLAKELTDKWDPSQSNESDPGVVLLKEGAFIADHGNYNIDKNILENFLPTATQESSVRNILDLNGYNPGYYVAATGDISITYNPTEAPIEFTGFVIPPFSLVITNEDESVFYTQISSIPISRLNEATIATFMEGTISTLSVNGSSTILLENLDDNNRLYFPIKQVAENGIFIKNINSENQATSDYWEKKNYISTQPLNSKVYKVGYDSSLGVPYVEFPSDIANIIGNGITISYITTSGDYGNVKANTLKKVSTPATFNLDDETTISTNEFNITNLNSITNGKDPETINEMYRSFKKIVGTFDTLVTCKDYSNAIFNATDETGVNKLVSNDVVTDRNNDYNNSFKIVTYDQYGEYFEIASKLLAPAGFTLRPVKPLEPSIGDIIFEDQMFKMCVDNSNASAPVWSRVAHLSYNDFVATVEAMTPFDLCIYALKAFSLSDYISSAPAKAIESSFTPITSETYGAIQMALEENKCINHDFLDAKNGDVICFKNYVPLNITITPYTKVTKQEKEEIIDTIYRALSKYFNASKVDFGEELNYDEVLEVLLNCDDRIKNIRLEDFEYIPKALVKDATLEDGYKEVPLYDIKDSEGYEILLDVVAKNILAGRLCLFDFDDEFTYKYGQIGDKVYNDLVGLSSSSVISPIKNSEVTYTSLNSTNTPVYAKYDGITTSISITGSAEGQSGKITIPVEGGYILNSNEILYVKMKGIVTHYSADGIEHEIEIINNTSSTIYIEYIGAELNNWVNLTDGQINIIDSYMVVNEEVYDLNYQPEENEIINIAYNSYTSDAIFTTYVNYRFTAEGSEFSDDYFIAADTDHLLLPGESLILVYTENEVEKSKKYEHGEVIRANFKLIPTDKNSTKGVTKTVDNYAAAKYIPLAASQQIEHRQLMETVLNTANTPCYWIVNNNTNTLFYNASSTQARTNEVILNTGEYFIYSNANKDSFIMLGPGTLLKRSEKDDNNWTIPKKITLENITTDGAKSIDWKSMDFSGDKKFIYQEMNIITLAPGDSLKISDWSSEVDPVITNKWRKCTGTITYVLASEGVAKTLPELPLGEFYRIRSRLDIALTKTTGQKLLSGQSFTVTYSNGKTETIVGDSVKPVYIQSSVDFSAIGDMAINISELTNGSATLDLYKYNVEKPVLTVETFIAQNNGIIDPNKTYYKIENNKYEPIPSSTVEQNRKTGLTSFEALYNVYSDSLWYIKGFDTEKALDEYNGKYVINIEKPGTAKFKFAYRCKFSGLDDEHREYILPVFLNYGGAPIKATIKDLNDKVEDRLEIKIKDFNIGTKAENIQLNNTEMYLLQVVVDNPSVGEVNTNLSLTLTWDTIPEDPEVVNIFNPNIVNGVNSGFGPNIELGDVLNKIGSLIENSTKPNVKPYYIYRPENSIAIQTNDIEDPLIFWDKNNIINCLTIPQIDIRTMADKNYPTIDIIKSMRNYK